MVKRLEVVLETARVDGALDVLAEMADGGVVLEVVARSLQTGMDLGVVDLGTGEVVSGGRPQPCD